MNLFADIRALVLRSLDAMVADGALPGGLAYDNVTTEPPRDAAHGDMATNAAMVLAKPAGLKPRDIAEALAAHLVADPRIASAEVAGPGFLNLRLVPAVWQGVVGEVLVQGTGFGLGGSVVLDPGRARTPGSVGDFAWGGMASTYFWVDRTHDLSAVFFTPLAPSSSYPSRSELKALVHGAMLA